MSLPSRTKRGSRPDVHLDVDVAGARSPHARVALAADADALPVVDPGAGCRPRSCARRARGRRRGTSVHGVSILRPEPPQVGHVCVRTNSPKTLRETCCSRPDAAARRAGRHLAARLGPVAAAVRARDGDLERHLARRALRRFDELDLHGRRRGRRRASAPRPAEQVVAEERREEIGEAAEVEVARLEAAAAQARVAVAVVELARLRLREHLVRLDDLAEAVVARRARRRRRGAARARARGRPS